MKPHVTKSRPELYRFHPQLKYQCQGDRHGAYGETIGQAIEIYYQTKPKPLEQDHENQN